MEGFKNTDVGSIPKDWSVKTLGEVGEVRMCKRIFNHETKEQGEIPFFKIGTFGKEPDAYITKKQYENYRQRFSFPKKGDILISAAGTIGRTLVYDGSPSYYQDSNIVWIENNEEVIPNEFLYHVLQVVKYSTEGGTIQRLYNNILRNTKFSCPPTKAEQTAIATALNDADALIQKLEQLIAKKRLIKQGAMQKCLNPDFYDLGDDHDLTEDDTQKSQNQTNQKNHRSDKWEVKKLGEVADISKGQLITEKTSVPDGVPVIGGGMTFSYYHNKPNREGITITISASGAYAGYVSIHNYPIFASDCSTISEEKEYDIYYLYFCLLNKQREIYALQTGGGQPHVYPQQLRDLFIPIPKDKTEQTRIAQILSDMDNEIEALEKQLEKYKMMKQGMMQVLLTGKIRLNCDFLIK
jgi:type I restriction enzyme S subunit